MDKLTDLLCLTIFFDKFNILASFICTFLQILRDTSQQDFPIEQGHGVPLHKVWGEAFYGRWETNVLSKFIGGLLYMGVNELTIELSN